MEEVEKRKRSEIFLVTKGHKPGIYEDWFDDLISYLFLKLYRDSCIEQIEGFPGGEYLQFSSTDEAERYRSQNAERPNKKVKIDPKKYCIPFLY